MERDRDIRERDRHRERERERERDKFRDSERERDGERDRGRFDRRRGETTRIGAGESYKPYGSRPRTPLRTDTFRSKRDRSPRRELPRSPTNNWHPNRNRERSRRRTRSPPRRDRTPLKENWRARSPRRRSPHRRPSPRREVERRIRSPPRRDERRNSRSPFDSRISQRNRTPIRRVSPPAAPRGFRPRSRTPDRREVQKGPHINRRRRSLTPQSRDLDRPPLKSNGTPRRLSPTTYSDRAKFSQSQSKPRSPLPRISPGFSHRERDSMKQPVRERQSSRSIATKSPPKGPSSLRTPTGPGGSRNFTAPTPFSSNSRAIAVASRQKVENPVPVPVPVPVAPPVGPRGYVPRGGSSVRGGRKSFINDRVGKSDTSSWGSAVPENKPSTSESIHVTKKQHKSTGISTNDKSKTPSPSQPSTPLTSSTPSGPSGGVPTGPRAGVSSRPSLSYQQSSSMYSRSIKLVSNHNGNRSQTTLANTVSIIPSGRIDPTATGIPPDIAARLKRKEEEEETLRAELNSKEEKLRKSLKHWDKLSRDSRAMGLRSDLSEKHVRTLAGEGVGRGAF
ncbi:putative serine arginine repetitive matrix protein 1 protein [Erysiphe neolycopersici]|uniref:Putative serine arginine repetitive matrix protein 1 protein n=1 Tax=Erysiphe neolycopersici TaxID=212602 RepID=A0A420HR99_9PEZI|nr:putative serine arginine repetitive matrix protein 1 protein [Erysiphe neolycopersici]